MTTLTATPHAVDPIAYLCQFVRERSAIELDAEKKYLLETRLNPLARERGHASLEGLVDELRSHGSRDLQRRVVEAMTTNETSFYRDMHPFEAIKTHVLPDLIARRANQQALTIWSAACSTGQEIYSLAILIREQFPQLLNWRLRLLATDLSEDVLARARKGAYTQAEMNRGLPTNILVKYFHRNAMIWTLRDEVTRMVSFSQLNLVEPWPHWPKVDLVLMRNVLIYFSVDTKKKVLAQARSVMCPDSYLFLGAAETTVNLDPAYDRQPLGPATAYRLK